MENNKQQHQILHSNCFLFIQVIFDAKNAYGVAVRISGRMNLDTYIPKLLTLAWTFSFKVWNSIFIFHELLLYISKVSNNIWTPSSSCILYVHCHENMVLCCCLSPSVCGKIVQPDHRPYKLHVPKSLRYGHEESQKVTLHPQPQPCTMKAGFWKSRQLIGAVLLTWTAS